MTVPEQIDALAILEGLIEGGVNADLRFPTAYSRRVEVEVDTISQPGRTYMLELRHVPDKESKKLFGKVKRVIRLYYFEPSQLPRTLAGLKLGSKPGDAEDRMGEQDSHIDDAHARCTSWVDDGMDTGGGENNDEIVSKP